MTDYLQYLMELYLTLLKIPYWIMNIMTNDPSWSNICDGIITFICFWTPLALVFIGLPCLFLYFIVKKCMNLYSNFVAK